MGSSSLMHFDLLWVHQKTPTTLDESPSRTRSSFKVRFGVGLSKSP